MVVARKKKQQTKKLFSQIGETDADFMIRQSDHAAQIKSKAHVADGDTSLNNTS